MTDEPTTTYEDLILEGAEAKRDLDVVYGPTFKALKAAFSLMFASENMSGSDFKRLSDMRYYQGGYPSPATPPKEHSLAFQVANLMKLERSIGSNDFTAFLGALGVRCEVVQPMDPIYAVSPDDEKKLTDAWGSAGIDASLPHDKTEALKLLLDKSQKLQKEICDLSDSVRVSLAEEVEDRFKIAKGNFMKAVGLATVRLKKGPGAMDEKVDVVCEAAENLMLAIEPLMKFSSQ